VKEIPTMQFIMFVCTDTEPVPEPNDPPDVDDWVATMDGRGVRLMGNPIHPEKEARTVRVRAADVLVTDGPFIETKEVLAGFDVLECRDMDEAVQVAAQHPMAHYGVIELRQIMTG
jgi:hypothetical protein